eukprot:4051860-Prymnesium_polylepis.3
MSRRDWATRLVDRCSIQLRSNQSRRVECEDVRDGHKMSREHSFRGSRMTTCRMATRGGRSEGLHASLWQRAVRRPSRLPAREYAHIASMRGMRRLRSLNARLCGE